MRCKNPNCIWKSRLSLSTKLKLYNVCILPIMLYGSECWALSKADTRKVDALDQWCLRRILDIRWYHHVSNWKVRHLTEQPPLITIIHKRRLMLFGHLVRMDVSADIKRILTAVPQSDWRRPVGRPYTFLDGHSEERPVSAQPYLGGCYRTSSGYAAVETVGSKRSYTVMVHAE